MSNITKLADQSKWTLFSSGIFVILQAIQLIIVTHYIGKDSFGYLSISNTFVFLCIALLESGVVLSIVQSDEISDESIFGILKFNLSFAIILSLGLSIFSWILMHFYDAPEIRTIIFWMLPFILLTAFNSVFIAKLKRAMEFKTLSILEMISFAIAFVLVIYLAINGFEYLAIVFGYLIRSVIMMIGLWFAGTVKLKSGNASISSHMNFGKYIYGEKILTALISNLDGLIIGKLIGMNDLGVYDVFKKIVMRPLLIFYNAIEQVAFSIFSELKGDATAYKSVYKSFVISLNYLVLPMIAMVLLNADWIIGFFPEDYRDYRSTLQLFCLLIGAIMILNPLDMLLYTLGKPKAFFRWMLMYIIPLIVILVASGMYGLNALIIACGVFYIVIYFVAYYFLIRTETPIDLKTYLMTAVRPILLISIITFILYALFFVIGNPILRLIISGMVFAMVYYLLIKKENNVKALIWVSKLNK